MGLIRRCEVAERLHVSMSTVRRLGKSGDLVEVQIGKRAVRVEADSVDRLIRSGALVRSGDRSPQLASEACGSA